MNLNRYKLIFIIILALSVFSWVGCDEDLPGLDPRPDEDTFEMTLTAPHDGQFNVPLSSTIIMYYSHELYPISITGKVSVLDDMGEPELVNVDVQRNSIVINSQTVWKPRTNYQVIVEPGIVSTDDRETIERRVFNFETTIRRPQSDEDLSIHKVIPAPEDPCWDFQTFRVFFNEPVDRTTLEYGKSVIMTKKGSDEPVPGNLFGRGNQIVFDPHQDLEADTVYELTVTTALKDYNGSSLVQNHVIEFLAKSTGKHSELAMDKCPTVVEGQSFCDALPDDSLFPKSRFIDYDVNSMYADSILLGSTIIKVGARLWNEFADTSVSPDRVPFVVRKGQRLHGKGLKGLIGGEITSGVDTGNFMVHVLADANGELLGSEYVYGKPGLPATIRLTMDATMTTENETSVAIMGQPILGVTLVGQATVMEVEDTDGYQAMVIELVGFTELELTGEIVPVTMSLQMVPPPTLPTEKETDTTPPEILSVSPVDMSISPENIDAQLVNRKAGDEIIVVFSEPYDPNTIRDNLTLTKAGGAAVAGTFDLYSPKAVFIPNDPMDPDTQYTITVGAGVTDLSGNKMAQQKQYSFLTMPAQTSTTSPPLLNATIPGRYDQATLPSNFFVELYFSQIIDESSLDYGTALTLYDNTDGQSIVPATVVHRSMFSQVVPDKELIPGHFYTLIITDDLQNLDGLGLDTDIDREPGGPLIKVSFTAGEYSHFVQTMLATYPYADANVNGYIDGDEYELDTNYMLMDFPVLQEPAYLMGYFPINIQTLIHDANGDPRTPIVIEPTSLQFGTNVPMSLSNDKADEPGLLDMGRATIELVAPSNTDLFQADDGLVGVDADTQMIFTVENPIMNALVIHETTLNVPGKLRFSKDGRMVVLLEGETQVLMQVPIIGLVTIPIHTKMTTSTPPPWRGF